MPASGRANGRVSGGPAGVDEALECVGHSLDRGSQRRRDVVSEQALVIRLVRPLHHQRKDVVLPAVFVVPRLLGL